MYRCMEGTLPWQRERNHVSIRVPGDRTHNGANHPIRHRQASALARVQWERPPELRKTSLPHLAADGALTIVLRE